ncbi:cupin domain-containing protein [Streptomyces sp. WAC06614]|uniref:cupin domain-containing protein n=1 Tax=Streptomyces sp. WAC06614 TaxID=2487416 RepID=UPI000F78CBBC|nr:cupin domain-containing protein [Streptomyces sp. WAC06614]RSS66661.1 cupin domain-containing protein [Streptomyces sp. WAC06614]
MDIVAREVVIEPGDSTGWHYHHVEIAAIVKSGTLTRMLHDGTVEVSTAGDCFVERAGAHHVHTGRNLGTEPVVLHLTYAQPEGSAFAVPTRAPLCLRDLDEAAPRPGAVTCRRARRPRRR